MTVCYHILRNIIAQYLRSGLCAVRLNPEQNRKTTGCPNLSSIHRSADEIFDKVRLKFFSVKKDKTCAN